MAHTSVLLKEVIEGLDLKEGDIYLDATVGTGGHMEAVWKHLKGKVELIGIDLDETSILITQERMSLLGAKPKLAQLDFRNIDRVPKLLEIERPTKILFDLGWGMHQMESDSGQGRGFSFLKDEPLQMTYKLTPGSDETNAFDVVNKWSEENLAAVIFGYGEERYSRRIARAIVEHRKRAPIKTSGELAQIIKLAVPVLYRFGRIHPATRTFQAIRIAVNDELKALENGLSRAFEILKPSGRMAVISFHSLEDRIVKNFFRKVDLEGNGIYPEKRYKKPISPSEEEVKNNPRSRSAKLRVIEKIKDLE